MTQRPMPSPQVDHDAGRTEREPAIVAPRSVDSRISPRFRRLIEAACARPDLAPLVERSIITLDLDLDVVFRVQRGGEVVLGSSALASPAMTALCLRHALELALLKQMTPQAAAAARALAAGLLAIRTAGFHLQAQEPADRASCRRLLPRWQREAFDLMTVARPTAVPKDMLASIASPLMVLQGQDFSAPLAGARDPIDWSLVSDILDSAGALAMPVEVLTGDGPAPSDEALWAADRLRRDLLSAALLGDLEAACASEWARLAGDPEAEPDPAALLALALRRAGG